MTATIRSETEQALKSLTAADSQATALECRLDQLDDKLDKLLESLESGQYGGSPEDIRKVMEQLGDVEKENNATQQEPNDTADVLEEVDEPTSPTSNDRNDRIDRKPTQITASAKIDEKAQHDALLDMMEV